jgi:hypothetical protein
MNTLEQSILLYKGDVCVSIAATITTEEEEQQNRSTSSKRFFFRNKRTASYGRLQCGERQTESERKYLSNKAQKSEDARTHTHRERASLFQSKNKRSISIFYQ